MQRVRRRRQIDRRTTRRDRSKLRRRLRSPLSRQLQHDVAAHREADQRQARNAVARDDLARHRRDIVRQPRVIEHRSERVRAATVALVVADHIHPRGQRLLGDAEHVLRIARPFEPVHNNDGQRVRSIRLPVAVAKHLDAGRDFDQPLLRRRQMKTSRDQESWRPSARVRRATSGAA